MQGLLHMDFLQYSTLNVFPLPKDFLDNILFPLACFIVQIQYIIPIIYRICVNLLFM